MYLWNQYKENKTKNARKATHKEKRPKYAYVKQRREAFLWADTELPLSGIVMWEDGNSLWGETGHQGNVKT